MKITTAVCDIQCKGEPHG